MIGGGNIFRGVRGTAGGMDRASADQMGMLATIINGIALQDALEKEGVATRHMSALEIRAVAEPFIRRRAIRHLEKGRIVIFTRRHGQPLLHHGHGRRPAGPGDQGPGHPQGDQGRRRLHGRPDDRTRRPRSSTTIRYMDVLKKGLKVMDATAISLCKDNDLPIIVFNLRKRGNIKRAVLGQKVGTKVY